MEEIEWRPSADVKTLEIISEGVFLYNPNWVDSLSDEELLGAIHHELGHHNYKKGKEVEWIYLRRKLCTQ